jgi:hypothetical protein
MSKKRRVFDEAFKLQVAQMMRVNRPGFRGGLLV